MVYGDNLKFVTVFLQEHFDVHKCTYKWINND
jgi:hypothetical protein